MLPPGHRPAVIAVTVTAVGSLALGAAAVVRAVNGDDDASATPSSTSALRATPTATTQAPRTPTPTTPAQLLPNMRTLPASNVYLSGEDGDRLLRFAASLANIGPGPLELLPDEGARCPRAQRGSQQVVYLDGNGDGRFTRNADGKASRLRTGCMLFHPSHKHWHFDASARYVLTRPGNGTPIVAREKVSFCMRDNRPLRRPGAGTREHFGDCKRDSVQGISAGWVDVYRASLPGQSLRLPRNLPAGVYCLQITADPHRLLREAREDDNTTITPVRITTADAQVVRAPTCG